MNKTPGFSINFSKVIEQAERELRCENRDGCRDCGACANDRSLSATRTTLSVEKRTPAAAVSTD